MKPCGPGLCWEFLITAFILLVVIGIFRFSVFLDSVLEGYMLLEVYPFLLDGQISWHVIVVLIILYICVVLVVTSVSFMILFGLLFS